MADAPFGTPPLAQRAPPFHGERAIESWLETAEVCARVEGNPEDRRAVDARADAVSIGGMSGLPGLPCTRRSSDPVSSEAYSPGGDAPQTGRNEGS